jgi:hypothetical protein
MSESIQKQIDDNKRALRYLVNEKNRSLGKSLLLEMRINDRKQTLKKLIQEM